MNVSVRSPAVPDRLARACLVTLATATATLVFQCCLGANAERVTAQQQPGPQAQAGTIRILPASTTVDVGETITVEVWLEDVGDYYGVDFRLSFDPEVVRVPTEEVSPLWDVFDAANHWTIINEADNVSGTVQYAVTNLNPAEPFTGTGRVCIIGFSGVTSGTVALDFTYAKGATRRGVGLYPTQVGGEITVESPPPKPMITTLDPSSALAGGPGLALVVNGANFTDHSAVRWDDQPRPTTFVSSTRLTADIAAADIATAATVDVEVANSPDPEDRSNTVSFAIQNPVPQIISLNPVSATVGRPAFSLTVRGASFVTSSVVRWDGEARTTTFISATRVTAQIAATDLSAPDTVSITVVNPTPGGGTSNVVSFTIERAPETEWTIFLPLVVRSHPQARTNGTHEYRNLETEGAP